MTTRKKAFAFVIVFVLTLTAFTDLGKSIGLLIESSAYTTDLTPTDIDAYSDSWYRFVYSGGRGYLKVNYSPSDSEKQAVIVVQKMMNFIASENGQHFISEDSIYGKETAERVREIQTASGYLDQDSCCGPATFQYLVDECSRIIELRRIKAGSSVDAPTEIVAPAGSAIFDITINTSQYVVGAQIIPNNLKVGILSQSGNTFTVLVDSIQENATVSVRITTSEGSYDTVVKVTTTQYDVDAAIAFAKKYAYKYPSWLCAEFVSRSLRAGGIDINVIKGVGDLYRALLSMNGVSLYELEVSRSGGINANTANNKGKIKKADVIIITCDLCESAPYNHAVLVGDTDGKVIKVYAHNNSYSNLSYYGFDSCPDHGCGDFVKAWCFHFD